MIVKLLTEHHLEFLSLKGGAAAQARPSLHMSKFHIVGNIMPRLIFLTSQWTLKNIGGSHSTSPLCSTHSNRFSSFITPSSSMLQTNNEKNIETFYYAFQWRYYAIIITSLRLTFALFRLLYSVNTRLLCVSIHLCSVCVSLCSFITVITPFYCDNMPYETCIG